MSLSFHCVAQSTKTAEEQAALLLSEKQYDKALPLLRELFNAAPFDKRFYDNYRDALIEVKQYDTAIALGSYMATIRREDLTILLDVGKAYEYKGQKKEAEKYYDKAIAKLNGNEFQMSALLTAFKFYNRKDYEIKAIENYREKMKNPFMYGNELAILYNETGETDKAIEVLLASLEMQPYGLENSKQALENIMDNNKSKTKKVAAALAKRAKQDPQNLVWRTLNTWMQTKNGNAADALKSMIALDEQQGGNGIAILNYAKELLAKDEKDQALRALAYILKKEKSSIAYEGASIISLQVRMESLTHTYPVDSIQLNALLNDFASFFEAYPKYKKQFIVLDYTALLALYAHQTQRALSLLQENFPNDNDATLINGHAKLTMGDYLILTGKVWQAALQYAQVDKLFKEDALGEEARFRNAKLSYYRGDFEYAQTQLSVLKASTSELIANDALYLSVLITENSSEDKDPLPFRRFAYADLLQFQNKYEEASVLLDSIAKAYPESPLQDDILMQLAHIAVKKQSFMQAVSYLETIQNKYGEDVLGDDATMRLAEIYEENIKDKAKAVAQYEHLITAYPGSTYIQQARTKYDDLTKK